MTDSGVVASGAWLLMIHQIPPKPDYLRVKIGRRLQRVGAVAVKNSVYVLPDGDQTFEDFQWIRREIIDGGGDASICRASFVDGLTDDELRAAFREARDADYAEITAAARGLRASPGARSGDATGKRASDDVARLEKRFAAVAAIDFFEAKGRAEAHRAIELVGSESASSETIRSAAPATPEPAKYRARTWVTRKGVFVDRMASAWLIRRFIDPDARFRFVDSAQYRATPGELRFDMFEGEFTHVGDRCTFETLLDRFSLDDPALRAIAEIVHDIDLKDDKFGRDDVAGVERALLGITHASADDTRAHSTLRRAVRRAVRSVRERVTQRRSAHVGAVTTPNEPPTDQASRPTVEQLARYFLWLGTAGFGGPIALVGYMERTVVSERRWVTRQEFADGLAFCQLAPGPLAAQLAIYLGWLCAGVRGATAVGIAFVGPSFAMVIVLAVLYLRFGGMWWLQGAFYGVGAAVIAIIARSAYKLTRTTLGRDRAAVGGVRREWARDGMDGVGDRVGVSALRRGSGPGANAADVVALSSGVHVAADSRLARVRAARPGGPGSGVERLRVFRLRGIVRVREWARDRSVSSQRRRRGASVVDGAPVPGRDCRCAHHPRPGGDHGGVHRLPRRGPWRRDGGRRRCVCTGVRHHDSRRPLLRAVEDEHSRARVRRRRYGCGDGCNCRRGDRAGEAGDSRLPDADHRRRDARDLVRHEAYP